MTKSTKGSLPLLHPPICFTWKHFHHAQVRRVIGTQFQHNLLMVCVGILCMIDAWAHTDQTMTTGELLHQTGHTGCVLCLYLSCRLHAEQRGSVCVTSVCVLHSAAVAPYNQHSLRHNSCTEV